MIIMLILVIFSTVNIAHFSLKKETPFLQHYRGGQPKQQDRLDNLAIWVCCKYLVEVSSCNVEDNCDGLYPKRSEIA
jgi:hypothetical protein